MAEIDLVDCKKRLPRSGKLLTWLEMKGWLLKEGYPSRVRVFEGGSLADTVILESVDEIYKLKGFSVDSAMFYGLRVSPEEVRRCKE